MTVKNTFKLEISGRSSVALQKVVDILSNNLTVKQELARFTMYQIVAKFRYEKQKMRSK
jgi:hypothetical protein